MVTTVTPAKLGIGDVMTVTGKNFRKGKNKNTVVFKRDGGRAVFVKAPDATTTKIGVTVPAKLLPFLLKKKGKRTFTRFRIRVLAKRFAKSFTPKSKSPMIGPDAIGGGTKDDCDGDKIKNKVDDDDDNDLIPDTLEATLGTDPCKRDTDGDGESDGWEYYSALDRNGSAKPAPFAKPYPNPLDGKDADIDHDGDGLTDIQEYSAWASFGGNKLPLSYSGGNPASAGRGRPPASQAYMDRDGNGFLSDFERDADGDGIPNMDEGGSKDVARITKSQASDNPNFYDYGLFTLSYIKLAMGQTKDAEPTCEGINQVPFYCLDGQDGFDVEKVDPARLAVGRHRRRRHPRRPGRPGPRRRPEHHRVPAGDRGAVQGPQVPPARRLRPQLRRALLPARERRRRRRRDLQPRRHRRRRRRPARHPRAAVRPGPAARRHRRRRRLRRLRVLVGPRPQRRGPSLPRQGALPQRAGRHRREHRLRRRRPHAEGGVPGLELLRPAAAPELQRRQPLHRRHRAARR